MPIADQIRSYPNFTGLTEKELASLSIRLTRRTFAKNAYLYLPGNPGLNLYLIESGLVRLFTINSKGQEFLLDLIGPLSIVGLPGLMDDQSRPAGAVAQRTTIALVMTRADLFYFMGISSQFNRNILKEMAANLRKLVTYAQSLACLSLNQRLAALILHLIGKDDRGEQRKYTELPLTQAELASWLGASRGRVNTALSRFHQLGLIEIHGKNIHIIDHQGLARLIGE
jgi:CRP-like cAMP-binding protein